jgi:hypothetical protein
LFTPTTVQLNAALPAVSQLPHLDFSPQRSSSGGSETAALTGCPALLDMQASVSDVASAAFSAGTTGPYLNEVLVQYTSIAEAADTMAQFEQVPRSCGLVHTELGGFQLDISISAQPFPAYRDQPAAFGIEVTFAGTTVSVDAQIAAAVLPPQRDGTRTRPAVPAAVRRTTTPGPQSSWPDGWPRRCAMALIVLEPPRTRPRDQLCTRSSAPT